MARTLVTLQVHVAGGGFRRCRYPRNNNKIMMIATSILYLIVLVRQFSESSSFLFSSNCGGNLVCMRMALVPPPGKRKFEGRTKAHRFGECRSFSALHGSGNLSTDSSEADNILLCINFSTPYSTTGAIGQIVGELRAYVRSFPYAAVLPVQPMQYLPSDSGVTITFLRKKTQDKGMVDGGIQIDIVITTSNNLEEDDALDENENGDSTSMQLTALRISDGQTVNKVFSEKIVVLKILEGISAWVAKQESEHGIQLSSVYHKWM